MSGEGRPTPQTPDAHGLTVGIVATEWNSAVVDVLLERALAVAAAAGTSA